jgi:hypothetical protein
MMVLPHVNLVLKTASCRKGRDMPATGFSEPVVKLRVKLRLKYKTRKRALMMPILPFESLRDGVDLVSRGALRRQRLRLRRYICVPRATVFMLRLERVEKVVCGCERRART